MSMREGKDGHAFLFRRAEQEEKLFKVEKLEQYLFNETHTYTEKLFQKNFVKPIEDYEKKHS